MIEAVGAVLWVIFCLLVVPTVSVVGAELLWMWWQDRKINNMDDAPVYADTLNEN